MTVVRVSVAGACYLCDTLLPVRDGLDALIASPGRWNEGDAVATRVCPDCYLHDPRVRREPDDEQQPEVWQRLVPLLEVRAIVERVQAMADVTERRLRPGLSSSFIWSAACDDVLDNLEKRFGEKE